MPGIIVLKTGTKYQHLTCAYNRNDILFELIMPGVSANPAT